MGTKKIDLLSEYKRLERRELKQMNKNVKRARRYRKRHGLPDTAIVILMPKYRK